MAISYSFVDDETYGTEDINDITRDLTGAGIAPFPNHDTYSVSDLNALTEVLVGSGTTLGGCKCTYSAERSVITVTEGIVFFENGTKLRIDEKGFEVKVSEEEAGYVYAVYDTALQTGAIKLAAEFPVTGDFVTLCRIDADGNVYDLRTFARSKVMSFGRNAVEDAQIEWLDVPYMNENGTKTLAAVNSDISKFNYAVAWHTPQSSRPKQFGLFDLSKGCFVYSVNGASNEQIQFFSGSHYAIYNLEVIDGRLYVTAPEQVIESIDMTITLI